MVRPQANGVPSGLGCGSQNFTSCFVLLAASCDQMVLLLFPMLIFHLCSCSCSLPFPFPRLGMGRGMGIASLKLLAWVAVTLAAVHRFSSLLLLKPSVYATLPKGMGVFSPSQWTYSSALPILQCLVLHPRVLSSPLLDFPFVFPLFLPLPFASL